MTIELIDYISLIANIVTILAVITLIRDLRKDAVEKRKKRAEEVRIALNKIVSETGLLVDLLTEGTPLIAGAAEIAKECGNRLADSTSNFEMIRKLGADNGLLLSCVVNGWLKSPITSDISNHINEIRKLQSTLRGISFLLAYPIDMLLSIVDKSYSYKFFIVVLETLIQVSTPEQEQNPKEGIDGVNWLAIELQSSSTRFFIESKYEEISKSLKGFIAVAAGELSKLNDGELIAESSQIEEIANNNSLTRTESVWLIMDQHEAISNSSEYEELHMAWHRVESLQANYRS